MRGVQQEANWPSRACDSLGKLGLQLVRLFGDIFRNTCLAPESSRHALSSDDGSTRHSTWIFGPPIECCLRVESCCHWLHQHLGVWATDVSSHHSDQLLLPIHSRSSWMKSHLPGNRTGDVPPGMRLLDVSAARSVVLDARAAARISPGVCAVIPRRSSLSGRLGWSAR